MFNFRTEVLYIYNDLINFFKEHLTLTTHLRLLTSLFFGIAVPTCIFQKNNLPAMADFMIGKSST